MLRRHQLLNYTYLLGFLFYIHSYLPVYLHSSYIGNFIGENSVGFVFMIASVLSIGALLSLERVIRRFGNFRTIIFSLLLQFIVFIALAIYKEPIFIIPIFVIGQILIRTILFNIDIFLESQSENKNTGNTRGVFLTITNLVVVTMPFVATSLLVRGSYEDVYFLSALALLPVILLVFFYFKKFEDRYTNSISLKQSLKSVMASKNLKSIFISNALLRVFYATMVIYSPIYLHEVIGFGWDKLGLMFSIMLLPFVLFELPLGKIADKHLGEKELLIGGFLLCGLSTAAIFFNTGNSFVVWTAILFLTRTGASMIDIMTETYFFKKTDSNHPDTIALYRMIDPLGYLVAPIFGFIAIYFGEMRLVFIFLGIALVLGTWFAYRLKDTR